MRASVLALLLGVGGATAAEPTVEVRVRAINDLLPVAEYLGELVDQEEQAKQFTGLVRAFAGRKGLEGIDIKRPIGMYARLTPNMIDSPIVLLLPLADEAAFLNLLKQKAMLDPKQGDDGIYEVQVPNLPPPVFFKFHAGYVCGTVLSKGALADAELLDPKAFFAKPDPSLMSVQLHLDRLPAEVRKSVLGQMELKIADAKKANADKPKPEQRANDLGLDVAFRSAVSLLEDGRSASLRLLADPRTDELAVEFMLSAKDGSDLKSRLASAGRRPSAAASAAGGTKPIAAVSANFALPDWVKTQVNELIGIGLTQTLDNANGEQRPVLEKLFEALGPTLKAGTVDLAVGLTAADSGRRLTAALAMTEGTKVEDLAKEFAPFLPPEQGKLTTDVAKAGGGNLHKLSLADPEVADLFGTGLLWLVTSDRKLVLTAEPDGESAKQLAAAEPAPAPLFRAEVSVARAAVLLEKRVSKDQVAALTREVFGDATDGKDTLSLTVTAGERLSVKFAAKGKAVQFLAKLDQKAKGK